VVGVAFALLWWKGYLLRLRNYWQETMVEMKKCTWPTWEELKGSTVLMAISILALGLFTVAVDYIFVHVVYVISKV
jgi:preprotein translocase subunit SecE